MLDSLKVCNISRPAWKKHDALIMHFVKLMDFLSIHFRVSKYFGFKNEEASNSIALCGES